MKPVHLLVATSMALAGAGCSGEDAVGPVAVEGTEAAGAPDAEGSDVVPSVGSTTSAPNVDGGPSSAEASPTAGTTPAAAPTGSTTATSGSADGGNVPTPIATGTYTYDTDGESQLGLAAPRSMPSRTTLQAKAPDAGDNQRLVRDYRDSDGLGTRSEMFLQYGVEGVVLHALESTTTVRPLGSDVTNHSRLVAKPPTVIAPVDMAVGFRTTLHLEGDGVTADGTVHITGREQLTIGGATVDVFIIDVDVTFKGDTEGEQHSTWWVRPSDLLVVREKSNLEAASDGITYREEQTSQLRSLSAA